MAMLAQVSSNIGRSTPPPRLRVVREADTIAEPATRTFRPDALSSFIGQSSVTYNLQVACAAAAIDGELPDHILLEGPAGLGKTSLAKCVAECLGVRCVEIPATAMTKINDAACALAKIGEPADGPCVVFMDEIHGVCKKAQTLLLSALEDGFIQPSGMAERLVLAPFVMIGATTNPGQLSRPLLDRFTIREALDYYDQPELEQIITRYAEHCGLAMDTDAVTAVANVGRGTPRVANGIVRRVATMAKVAGTTDIAGEDITDPTQGVLARLGIDEHGLESQDRKILTALAGQSRPVGLDMLANMLGIENDAVKNRESYLLRSRLISCTKGGRVLTRSGYRAIGETAPVWMPS